MDGWDESSGSNSGFEDDPGYLAPCNHRQHIPPMHIVVPLGKRYRHVCPGCGKTALLYPSQVRMQLL